MKTDILSRLGNLGLLLLLSSALCVSLFYQTALLAQFDTENRYTFVTSHSTLQNYAQLRKEWRPRVLSNAGAHLFGQVMATITASPADHLRATIGAYSAFWLFLTNALLIAAFGRSACVYLWGISAAVVFGYMPGIVTRVYPWDMPALFFFTLFLVAYAKKAYRFIPYIILTGLLFKETTVVLCGAFLFFEIPWKKRLSDACVTSALFVAVKVGIDIAVGNPLPFFSMSERPPGRQELRLFANLHTILTPALAHPVWLNAGTFAALLVLPVKTRAILMSKCIAILFAINLLLFGMIQEYRIWFEMAPLAVYALIKHFEREPAAGRA